MQVKFADCSPTPLCEQNATSRPILLNALALVTQECHLVHIDVGIHTRCALVIAVMHPPQMNQLKAVLWLSLIVAVSCGQDYLPLRCMAQHHV